MWATWLGGSGNDAGGAIQVDADKNVYLMGNTYSTDMPTTAGAAKRTYSAGTDCFLAKVSPDGSTLLYGTYFGGSGEEYNNTHNMTIDKNGNAYLSSTTDSPDLPTTPGAFQRTMTSVQNMVVGKFSPTGALLLCTYIGGSGNEMGRANFLGGAGNFYMVGQTDGAGWPAVNAYQSSYNGATDANIAVFSCGVPDTIPPDQGNVLRAVKRGGADVVLSWTGTGASSWRVYRDPAKDRLGLAPLNPDASVESFVDSGRVPPVPGAPCDYYRVKGLSPCSAAQGP